MTVFVLGCLLEIKSHLPIVCIEEYAISIFLGNCVHLLHTVDLKAASL